jgi:hypothetical protein
MADFHPYSDELTGREADLGFQLREVKNPHGEFAYSLPTVRAVVLPLGPSDRIIKLNNPTTGRPAYQHQRYGTWTMTVRADWKPVQVAFPSPELAIRSQSAGYDTPDPMFPPVSPVDPGDNY